MIYRETLREQFDNYRSCTSAPEKKEAQKILERIAQLDIDIKEKNKEIIMEEMYGTLNEKYMEAIKMSLEQIGKAKMDKDKAKREKK